MTNLLYPAVLGAILYAVGDFVWNPADKKPSSELVQLLLALALVVLFTLDYAYTLNDNQQTAYGAEQFVTDTAMLVLLYLAGKAVAVVAWTPATLLSFHLLAAKALAVLCEIGRLPKNRTNRSVVRSWEMYETDAYCFLGYLVVFVAWLLGFAAWAWLLLAMMLADAIAYLKKSQVQAQPADVRADFPCEVPHIQRSGEAGSGQFTSNGQAGAQDPAHHRR